MCHWRPPRDCTLSLFIKRTYKNFIGILRPNSAYIIVMFNKKKYINVGFDENQVHLQKSGAMMMICLEFDYAYMAVEL